MKKLLLVLFTFTFISFINAQDKPEAEPLQYPFDEIGTESTRGIFGLDDRKEVKDAEDISDYVRATAVMIPKKNIKEEAFIKKEISYKISKIIRCFSISLIVIIFNPF